MTMPSIFILVFIAILLPLLCGLDDAKFTCQGTSYNAALNACPDGGAQAMSAGGNVTIRVIRATNLPNKDNSATVAGVSDPYVKFTVGDVVVQTGHKRNSLNPHWDQSVSLGFLGSATEVTVEIWDKDGGLEYGDDLIVRSTFRVPFCSYFYKYANLTTYDCGSTFGCSVDDSMWQMPTRKVCVESGVVNFNPSRRCSSIYGTCLYLEISLVPFAMGTELTYKNALIRTPELSVAGSNVKGSWATNFGFPFLDTSDYLDVRVDSTRKLKGALMFRMLSGEKNYGSVNAIKFYASTNFPADMYVCRYQDDNDLGVPTWITNNYDGRYARSRQLLLRDTSDYFDCYAATFPGTVKNKWGGVLSGAIPFRSNKVDGVPNFSYKYNYIILGIPTTVSVREDIIRVFYDASGFVGFLGSYGLICFWFIYLGFRFLSRFDYRIDRISNFLLSRVLTGKDRSLVASLFMNNHQSPCNIHFRAYMFHAKNIVLFFLLLPFFLLLSWGVSVSLVVRPPMLGVGITFIGSAFVLFTYGFKLWERGQWRLSMSAVTSFLLSATSFILFLLAGLFLDLGVIRYGADIDIIALSLIFGTINCIPCLFLIFKQDRSHKVYMEKVVNKVAEAVALLKGQQYSSKQSNKMEVGDKSILINRMLHALLGETYSINPKLPSLRFSGVMQEVGDTYHNVAHSSLPDNASKIARVKELLTEERQLYGWSIFILFIYLMFASARTSSGSLAFLNVCALLLLDFIHMSVAKGECHWSPGFKVLLLVMGRILICSSPKSIWIINYSACYIIYSLTLINEMIDVMLPKLTLRKAGELVFGGANYQESIRESLKTMDVSGSAGFCFGFLVISFIAVLIISAYLPRDADGEEQLIVPTLNVLGMHTWPAYIFGLISFLVSAIAGLGMATKRIFDLDGHGLLRGWAKDMYLFRQDIKLPTVFALSTEGSILLSGLLIYAITDAAAVLVGSIFLPVIIICFSYAGRIWVKNDYELVVWPRKEIIPEAEATYVGDGSTLGQSTVNGQNDLETAFNMIENLFGSNNPGDDVSLANLDEASSIGPETDDETSVDAHKAIITKKQTLKGGFALPPLRPTGNKLENKEIKMPPLPLKSVLRRKRQNMGIKTQGVLPLVKDLNPIYPGKDNDQFGNKKDDVIDINDPWAQFEITEEEEALLKKKKRTGVAAIVGKNDPTIAAPKSANGKQTSGTSLSYIEFVKKVKHFLRTNKIILKIAESWKKFTGFFRRQGRVYPASKYQATDNGDLDDEDLDDEENPMRKKPRDDENEEEDLVASEEIVDPSKLDFWEAFVSGFLTNDEYLAVWSWFGGLFFVALFGLVLALSVQPYYLGYCVWVAIWLVLFFYIPIYKYFQVYSFDETAYQMIKFGLLVHFLFCVCFFGGYLESDAALYGSLWILDFFFYYPLITYLLFWVFKWADSSFKMALLDSNQDGQLSLKEVIEFLQTFPVMLSMVILLNWQFYVWINYTVGIVFTLFLLVVGFAYIYIKDWATNDYFLSPQLATGGKMAIQFTMFISFCVALFRDGYDTSFAVSVFFFAWAFYRGLAALGRYTLLDKSSIFFFSPFIFPVYSYNTTSQDLMEESQFIINLMMVIFLGMMWGIFMMIFFNPIHIGVSISCCFFLVIASIISLCISFIPRRLAKCNALLTAEAVLETANYAKEKFHDRRKPLSLEITSFDPDHNEFNISVQVTTESPDLRKTPLDKLKEKTCLENSLAIMADLRALKYIKKDALLGEDDQEEIGEGDPTLGSSKADAPKVMVGEKKLKKKPNDRKSSTSSWFLSKFGGSKKNAKHEEESKEKGSDDGDEEGNLVKDFEEKDDNQNEANADGEELKAVAAEVDEEEDEYEPSWIQKKVLALKSFARQLHELLPVNKETLYLRHQHAPFTWKNAFLEVFFTGRGPFGMFGLEGAIFRYLVTFQDSKNFSGLYPKWSEDYDLHGNYMKDKELAEPVDYPSVLARMTECDKALDFVCKEEARCAIHFILMLLVSADAKLEREKVLFQKFLRENRFRLASNGIAPPKDIFSSASFTSINIPLVAIWLSKLTPEEQDRFHMLKESFDSDQKERDDEIDQADYAATMSARDLEKVRKHRDLEYMNLLQLEITKRKEQRIQAFYDSLESDVERHKFMQRRDLWTRDPYCFVDLRETELYDKFRAKCKIFEDHSFEFRDYAVGYLMDCETAQRDIRLGEYGRQYQFVDSQFPPSELSLGDSQSTHLVLGWRCSPGIVENMQLFENGTHPDDVCGGVFNDQWLLSAMSMLVATTTAEGGLEGAKGFINEKIRALFVLHPTSAADPDNLDPLVDFTTDTEVGSYGVQIYRHNEWVPIIIDDLLPMRKKEEWTNENRGVAGAHCREGRGLWVSLIEKAFAKYYGSYSSLEEGFVHHALQDLTGCEAEAIPLSPYSRGYSKLALWDHLVQFKKNAYILGAGTGSADLVDQELQEMGIMFNSAYTIYDVIQVDNYRLLKLRNPPGDHSEWKGDWSDNSPLWNRRLKHKVNFTNDEFDNTFYISFDDFLNVFRYLYVCKYYNPKKWTESKYNGFWKKANEAEIEQMDLMNQFLIEQAEDMHAVSEIDQEMVNKKKAKARLDSAGGLPSKHNPGCVLENNPHYSLRIYRPTDIKVTVTQVPNNPKLTNKPNTSHTSIVVTPMPFSILVVRNQHPTVPQRLENLTKDDVLYTTGEPKAEKSLTLYITDLAPGLYTVLVGAYIAGMEGCFTISTVTNYRCEFSPVWPPAWMLKDDSKHEPLSAQEEFQNRMSKGRANAHRGMQQAGDFIARGIKSLLGGGDEFEDDEDDETSANKSKDVGDAHLDMV